MYVTYIHIHNYLHMYTFFSGHRHLEHVTPMDAERPLCRCKNEGSNCQNEAGLSGQGEEEGRNLGHPSCVYSWFLQRRGFFMLTGQGMVTQLLADRLPCRPVLHTYTPTAHHYQTRAAEINKQRELSEQQLMAASKEARQMDEDKKSVGRNPKGLCMGLRV